MINDFVLYMRDEGTVKIKGANIATALKSVGIKTIDSLRDLWYYTENDRRVEVVGAASCKCGILFNVRSQPIPCDHELALLLGQ